MTRTSLLPGYFKRPVGLTEHAREWLLGGA
jgi:hypothetical protein